MKRIIQLICKGCPASRAMRAPPHQLGTTSTRLLSSGAADKPTTSSYKLPEPTWSISDLELSKQHEPISEEELQQLAKRALLDMDQLEDAQRQQLRQDLGNLMHVIEQVQSFDHGDSELTDADIYDKPRGVTVAPLREDETEQDEQLDETAKKVWDSFLEPNTTKKGAHSYFSIDTKRK